MIELTKITILGHYFSKDGPWRTHARKFHNLSREQKDAALELMIEGIAPAKAIRKARRTVITTNHDD